jgi:hypothetical protein
MLRLGRILALVAVTFTAGCRTDSGTQSQTSQTEAKTAAVTAQSVTVTPTAVTTSSLSGETAIADNFDPASGIEPTWYGLCTGTTCASGRGGIAFASSDPVGAFRMFCAAGQLLKDDPLVYPGQPGVSHLHQFFGNTGANANSNYTSFRTSGGTTCGQSSTPINRSAYWMPASGTRSNPTI